jgi:hypothetical protein
MSPAKTMTVKGTGVMALPAFIKSKFPDRFGEWLKALPDESGRIHRFNIMAFELYNLHDALIRPTETMCSLFYDGDERGAWASGHFSAGFALSGFYKIFFKFGSPQFIINKASQVFSAYYPDGVLKVAESSARRCVLQLVKFPEPYRVVEMNIGGWMDGALELMGKKERTVEISRFMTKGDPVTEYVAEWN